MHNLDEELSEDDDTTKFLNDYISSSLTPVDLRFEDGNLLLENLEHLSEDTLNSFNEATFDLKTEQNESLCSGDTNKTDSTKENKMEYLNGLSEFHRTSAGRKETRCELYDTPPRDPCICQVCNEVFATQKEFETHNLLSHNSPKITDPDNPLFCLVCSKQFSSLSSLQRHKKKHATYKVIYKCERCSTSMASAEKLRKHIDTYHDISKFACEICPLSFSSSRAVNMHMTRAHSIPGSSHLLMGYICTYCTKKFKRKTQLVEHEAVHTKTYLYNCKFCKKPFRSRSAMHIHCTKLHANEFVPVRKREAVALQNYANKQKK